MQIKRGIHEFAVERFSILAYFDTCLQTVHQNEWQTALNFVHAEQHLAYIIISLRRTIKEEVLITIHDKSEITPENIACVTFPLHLRTRSR